MARKLHKAGKIKDLCEDMDFYHRLTALEAQFPNASVLVHKEGVLPPEIADLWGCNKLMSAARQLLGGKALAGALKMVAALGINHVHHNTGICNCCAAETSASGESYETQAVGKCITVWSKPLLIVLKSLG